MVRRIKIAALLAGLMLSGTVSSAQATLPGLYLSAFLDRHSLGVIDITAQLKPVIATASIGYWIRPGIGLEVESGFGVSDDSVGDLDVDFKSKFGVNLRLESPPREGFAAYALFGYVRSAYRTSNNGVQSSVSLPGGRLALGLTYILQPHVFLDAAFSHHDYDDETRINSFRFGLRYDFGQR